jgi:hypothetical protein
MAKLFDELKALKEAYDTKLSEEGEEAVKELFKELFDKHPQLESVTWRQYTPYFNDGDPCYFRVGEFEANFDGEDYDEEEDEEEEVVEEEAPEEVVEEPVDYDAINDAVYELADELPEEVLEHVFGDHVTITATRDGFDITEYEHD